jgi:hypothetical protein
MSDLFEVREKVEKGAEWRGTINVDIDGEVKELTVRQLRDPEFWEIMSKIDMDELQSLQTDLPEDVQEELRDLQQADDLDDEDRERLEELQEQVEEEGLVMFDAVSEETFEGIKQCAKYGVEPDKEDIRDALTRFTDDIQSTYGGTSEDDAREYVNDQVIVPMIERSTDFTSFAIGIRVLTETLEDEGN